MRKSTLPKSSGKRSNGFPLGIHKGTGLWCKKIRGRVHYFGSVAADPKGDKALETWLADKDDLLAGRTPRRNRDDLEVADLVNLFLIAKRKLVEAGEVSRRQWDDYKATGERIVEAFGRRRFVIDLRASDFETLRATLAKKKKTKAKEKDRLRSPTTLANSIQRVRTIFKFAYDTELIDRTVRFGPSFAKPSKKARKKAKREGGVTHLTAAEVKSFIDAAGVQMKAAILLGINCGFGNHDVATLPLSRLDLAKGWHNYERPKTEVDRRCPLWPETVKAIEAALAKRPAAKEDEDEGLVFITKHGARWVRLKGGDDWTEGNKTTWIDGIAQEFAKLRKKLGIERKGVTFYSLRRTFRTQADAAKDTPAARHIMGHAAGDDDMDATYVQAIDDARLKAVTDHVRAWLYPAKEGGAE